MSDHRAAQAVKLISALREQLHKMTAQLAWLERRGDNTVSSNLTVEIRFETEALRGDISDAHRLIDRLRSTANAAYNGDKSGRFGNGRVE